MLIRVAPSRWLRGRGGIGTRRVEVHGPYHLRLTDVVAGEAGTLRGWDLFVVSICD